MRFSDRTDAGAHLAKSLEHLKGTDAVVLGLPRGGVPVAFEVARSLGVPLDVIVVRKLGVPYQPELAMGAIGEGGIRVSNEDVIRRGAITQQEIEAVEQRERSDLHKQALRFREGRPHVDIAGRTAIIVDDGIATGSTASAACQVARQMGARSVILGAPVGAPESIGALKAVCDEVVCVHAPAFFMAVGSFYDNFRPVSDREVSDLLARAFDALQVTAGRSRRPAAPGGAETPVIPGQAMQDQDQASRDRLDDERPDEGDPREASDGDADPDAADRGDPENDDPGGSEVSHFEAGRHELASHHAGHQHSARRRRGRLRHHFIPAAPTRSAGPPELDEQVELLVADGTISLAGHLTVPRAATGIVVFVHGSGSSRHSPRNRFVAIKLNEAGLGTLMFDLLTADEELQRANVFDIQALAARLGDVTAWLRGHPAGMRRALGYFGASTGAAAALWAAAEPAAHIDAIVSRGGRPDLADTALADVQAPTLLIVGSRDEVVLGLNKQAQQQLRCENRLAIVPGATHLFEEPGALQTVTRLAREWFTGHFAQPGAATATG